MSILQKENTRKIFLAVIAVGVLLIGYFLPCPEGLSQGGKMTLVLLVFLFICWTGQILPNWLSSVAALLLLPLVGAADSMSQVYTTFTSSTFFFLLGIFGLAAMVHRSNWPSRLMNFFVLHMGTSSSKMILAFGLTTWFLSAFMSDLASCAIVAGIAIALTQQIELPKNFAKSLMIIIPLESMIGGISMPISSATNATIMQLLYNINGTTISYLQWSVVGFPCAIVLFFLTWWLVIKVFKPAPLTEENIVALKSHFDSNQKMSSYDIKTAVIIFVMLVMWVLGTWVSLFSTAFVALVGLVIMFFPGIDMLDWDYYKKEVPWDLILFVAALFALTSAMQRCGTITWLMNATLGNSAGWTPTMFFIAMSVLLAAIRGLLPGGPLLVAMVTGAVLAMGTAFGIDNLTLLITLSIWGQINTFLPMIDAQWLMTYNSGFFTTGELLKVTIPLTIFIIIATTLFLPGLCAFSQFAAV